MLTITTKLIIIKSSKTIAALLLHSANGSFPLSTAQMTSGKVSQLPDGSKVLYSIPTLQGSSGSPVIDRDGYVRAVNFAKLRGTDSFNFGIPEKQIINFLNQ